MSAAAADGGNDGGGGDGAEKEAREAATNKETRRRRAVKKKRTRKQSKSPVEAGGGSGSTMTTVSNGGGDGQGELLQQQQTGKRPRLVWTRDLHDKFVRAFKRLGKEAVPRKILAVMNINGLTRDNIASHLQKYRHNLIDRGQGVRQRGNGRATTTHSRAQAALPQAPAPAPPPSPPPNPASSQGPFADLDMPHQPPQVGVHINGNVASLLHQLPEFPLDQPMPLSFYPSPELQAAIHRRRIIMEQQAQHAAAARTMQQAAAAAASGGYNDQVLVTDYSLGAQMMVTGAPAASGVQGHPLPEPHMQAYQAVNMSRECSVPEASMGGELREIRMAQLQIAAIQAGDDGQGGAAEPGPVFADAANPDGDQQDDPSDILQFWNNDPEPSMDYEFPPNKPT